MKITHRISFGENSILEAKVDSFGIKYKKTPMFHGDYIITFEIDESEPYWPEIYSLAKEYNLPDLALTTFSKSEIISSEWLRLIPIFEQGYPEPKDEWISEHDNYEDYCYECGTFRQTKSFKMKQEPDLRSNNFMTFHWARPIFCVLDVVKKIESEGLEGCDFWDVIIHNTDLPSNTVRQLFVSGITSPGLLETDSFQKIDCPNCGVTKYYPHTRGIMKISRKSIKQDVDVISSYEWFGDGHFAFREIFISNRFAQLIIDNNWKGVQLKVVQLI